MEDSIADLGVGRFSFVLRAEEKGSLPQNDGHIFRAFLLNIIREADHQDSARLHDGGVLRPFSIQQPWFTPKENLVFRNWRTYFIRDTMLYFPFCTLNATTTEEINRNLMKERKLRGYTLGNTRFRLVKLESKKIIPTEDGKGRKKFSEDKLTLSFHTPCHFRYEVRKGNGGKHKRYTTWVSPVHVIKSLLTVYERLDHSFPEGYSFHDFLSWVEENITVYTVNNWKTEKYRVSKNQRLIGGRGTICWRGPFNDKINGAFLRKLLLFGEYANVGTGRTAGMGVFHIKPHPIA